MTMQITIENVAYHSKYAIWIHGQMPVCVYWFYLTIVVARRYFIFSVEFHCQGEKQTFTNAAFINTRVYDSQYTVELCCQVIGTVFVIFYDANQ